MSLYKFVNAIKQHANLVASRQLSVKIGIVSGYARDRYAVKVKLQPEDVETGWLPIFSPMVGKGWGFVSPPDVGTMVAVLFVEGNVDAGFVSLFGFGQRDVPPPNDVEPGGFLFYNKAGTEVKVSADGEVTIKAQAGKKVSVLSDSEIDLGKNSNAFKKLVTDAFKDKFNQHTHPGISTPPDEQFFITNEQLTEVVKGN